MSVNSKAICLLISMLLIAPAALADIVIVNGPNVQAASNGAIAAGGQYLITDPTGDAQDGIYWAVMGLHAFAFIPTGSEGYATVNFIDQQSSFDKTIDLLDDGTATHGDLPKFHLDYSGDVSANVYKTKLADGLGVLTGPAIAYANIGAGAADLAFPNGVGDADDTMIGASGMLSFLALPQYGYGNAGTDGIARYSVSKVGDPVMVGPNLASDEVLEIQGITNGCTGIGGVGDQDANNQALGIAALGTLSIARDVATGFPPAGEEGQSITATGMLTLAAAATTPFVDPVTGNVESPDSDVQAKVTSRATTGGAWDGSTPLGTVKQAGTNDNTRADVSGSTNSIAQTFMNGDLAASGSLLGDIAFHTASPLTFPAELEPVGALFTPEIGVVGVNDEFASQDSTMAALKDYLDNEAADQMGTAIGAIQEDLVENAEGALAQTGYGLDNQLAPFMPEFEFIVGEGSANTLYQVGVPGPDMVALDIAATGALAVRTQFGSPDYVSAVSYIDGANANSASRQIDRVVSVEKKDLNMASGAHIRNGPDFAGSVGYVVNVAAQDYNTPIFPTTGTYGTGSLYGAITLAPPASGDRWDDAGTYMKMKSATMETRMGSKYVRQNDGPVDAITWMAGNDLNPRIGGQAIKSTITDSISGNPSATAQIVAPLLYFEWPQGRASVWNTATGTLQI